MLLPGVGFDVVPSDCLALQLKEALPDAEFLRLGFQFRGGGFSRGTARTVVEGLGLGSIIRKNGKLISIREGSMTRNMDFGNGEKKVVTTPWGDVSTAGYSTGIPNVEVYFQFPSSVITMLKLSGFVGGILQTSIIQKYLLKRIENGPEGPDENALANGQSIIVGEVENKSGQQFRAKLISAQGYKLTAATAVLAAKKVLAGNFNPGFKTPSLQFGPLFAEETGLCQVSFEK